MSALSTFVAHVKSQANAQQQTQDQTTTDDQSQCCDEPGTATLTEPKDHVQPAPEIQVCQNEPEVCQDNETNNQGVDNPQCVPGQPEVPQEALAPPARSDGTGGAGGTGDSSNDPQYANPEICNRDADGIPLQDTFHWQHYWIRDGQVEAGMHPQQGGDPGYSGGLMSDTAMDNHHGDGDKPGSTCVPASQEMGRRGDFVDKECLDRALEQGTPTGKWYPGHTCGTVARDTLEGCVKQPPPEELNVEDGGGME
jgi:hypothetical protein